MRALHPRKALHQSHCGRVPPKGFSSGPCSLTTASKNPMNNLSSHRRIWVACQKWHPLPRSKNVFLKFFQSCCYVHHDDIRYTLTNSSDLRESVLGGIFLQRSSILRKIKLLFRLQVFYIASKAFHANVQSNSDIVKSLVALKIFTLSKHLYYGILKVLCSKKISFTTK